MQAATYTQGKAFSIGDVPEPCIGGDEMLLRIRATAICGTDIKIIGNGHRRLPPGRTIVLGHEFAGEVVETGRSVTGYPPGIRVGVAPNAGCGICDSCIRGQANCCPDYTAFGIDRDGSHAEYVKIPSVFIAQGNVIPLPASIDDSHASLLEPFSCVVNGIRNSRIELGNTVVIYGAGPIGLMHLLLARLSGAARIVVVDPVIERLERARDLGADETLDPSAGPVPEALRSLTGGRGADVAITACPSAGVQQEAVSVLAPFGRLCLFGGLPAGAGPVPLDTNAVHYRNLHVTGCTGGSVEDYRIALKLVAAGRVDLSALISDRVPMREMRRAYDIAMNGHRGKVVMVNA